MAGTDFSVDVLLDTDPDADATTLTVTRTGGLVSQLSWKYTASGLTIKTIAITRTNGLTTGRVITVYKFDGVTVDAQRTETINRTGGFITTVTGVRNS